MSDLIAEARTYLGTRFEHQARLKGVGVDCVGLLVGAAKACGHDVQDFTAYQREPDGHTLVEMLSAQCDPVPLEEMRHGDILAFWIRRPGLPQHVGIHTDIGLLHTYAGVGKVTEHVLNGNWRKRIHSVWRLRNG